jgi:hypothetical protein
VEPVTLCNAKNNECVSLPWVQGTSTFKYLGTPLGKTKIRRLRYADGLLKKVDILLDRLQSSGLKISQTIHAIKMFVSPKFDYLFHNTVVPVTKVKVMDKKIRRVINSLIGGQSLSKALFYSDWRSGGFGMKCLADRMSECRMGWEVTVPESCP